MPRRPGWLWRRIRRRSGGIVRVEPEQQPKETAEPPKTLSPAEKKADESKRQKLQKLFAKLLGGGREKEN